MLFSAQAWHWISPDVRYFKAREVLEPGGLLALFWNRPRWEASPLRPHLIEAYSLAAAVRDVDGEPDPMHPATTATPATHGWQREIAAVEGFERPQMRLYAWSLTYSTDEYLALLQTHSGHIVRPELERRAILDEVRKVIDANGGSIRLDLGTRLCLATAR